MQLLAYAGHYIQGFGSGLDLGGDMSKGHDERVGAPQLGGALALSLPELILGDCQSDLVDGLPDCTGLFWCEIVRLEEADKGHTQLAIIRHHRQPQKGFPWDSLDALQL